jgi:hypothetical protein
MNGQQNKAKPRHYQFSLQSLMIAILVAAAFCAGWRANDIYQAWRRMHGTKSGFDTTALPAASSLPTTR